jgi:hypothetical protein
MRFGIIKASGVIRITSRIPSCSGESGYEHNTKHNTNPNPFLFLPYMQLVMYSEICNVLQDTFSSATTCPYRLRGSLSCLWPYYRILKFNIIPVKVTSFPPYYTTSNVEVTPACINNLVLPSSGRTCYTNVIKYTPYILHGAESFSKI